MTSTAEALHPRTAPSWWRVGVLLALLGLFAAQPPVHWSVLWVAIPVAVATSLLASWRFGVRGLLVPFVCFVVAVTLSGAGELSSWWIPAAALSGAWMGLREETGGPLSGRRAWMLLPVLALATGMAWIPGYAGLVQTLQRELLLGDRQFLELMRQFGSSTPQLGNVQSTLTDNAKLRSTVLPYVLPTTLFVWIALLVWAGRTLASRISASLRWPPLSRAVLGDWRLPDGAVWLFLLGLALVVTQWSRATPAAWTLLLNAGLGYCIQGIAVVESLLLARGVPPSVITVTMAFVFTLATPLFMLTTVAVGLSDVWIDYRRMDAPPDTETS